MTAAHVTSLANAKTDIATLQTKMRIVQGAGCVVDGVMVYHLDTNRVGIMLMGYDLATGEREVEMQDFYIPAAPQSSAGVMTATHVKQLDALMQFLIETLKNASLHVHAVWLAIAYIAVILAMAVDFIAGLRKAKQAGKVTTSRALKMTTEKSAIKRAQCQARLSIAEPQPGFDTLSYGV